MQRFITIIFLIFISYVSAFSQEVVNADVASFHFLYQNIREGSIDEKEAQDSIGKILPRIKAYYIEKGGVPATESVFPVEGYDVNMIGGKRGSDYIPNTYNFYNSARITCHAAHDIFIADKNQDILDDNTNLPVNILSFSDGIVVAAEYFWDPTSTAKGGNYIYVYEPFSRQLYYYAHNDLVLVQLGQLVKAGEQLATMGRTGLNAYKQRSPTHLHFAMLRFDENALGQPLKPYNYLLEAKKVK